MGKWVLKERNRLGYSDPALNRHDADGSGCNVAKRRRVDCLGLCRASGATRV